SLHRLRGRIVDRDNLGSIARRRDLRPRIDHALDFSINAIARGTVGLRRNVDGLGVVTDQTTVGRFFDRHRLQLIGGKGAFQGAARDDVAVCNRAITSADGAVARVARFLVYVEKLGGLFD